MELRAEYETELAELRGKMEKAQAFAKQLPIFADRILESKITGEEDYIEFGKQYKKMYCAWGIRRALYVSGTNRTIGNYGKKADYSRHLFSIYVNCYSLFDCHEKFGLHDYLKEVKIFHDDKLNSTFYLDDKHIEAFLEALNIWIVDAYKNLEELRRVEKIEKLQAQLSELGAA